jgi:membrane-bound inhibitor of C-type lysozyme
MRHFTVVATIAIALSTGCQREAGDAAPDAVPAADSQPAAAATAPQPGPAAATAVLRWECDGGAVLTTKYLLRDHAIALGLHEGERKLPQVVSASGEKYQDGPITFWRKGDTAIYERVPAPAIGCRLVSG